MDDWLSSEENCIEVFVFRSAALPNFYKEQSLCPRQLARGLPKLWGITLTRSKLWNLILTFFNSNILYRITLGNSFMKHYWLCRGEKKLKKIYLFLEKMVALQLIQCLPKRYFIGPPDTDYDWSDCALICGVQCQKTKEYSGCYFGKLELSFFPILAYSSSRRTMRTLKGSRGLLDPSLTFSQRQLSDLRRRGRR